jgi:hypothetical protein
MTLVVPYQTITFVISAINPVMITAADKLLFMKGLNTAYFWLAIVNIAAIPPSVLRGSSKYKPKIRLLSQMRNWKLIKLTRHLV